MKFVVSISTLLLLAGDVVTAFHIPFLPGKQQKQLGSYRTSLLFESTVSDVEIVDIDLKQEVLDTAKRLKSEYGVLLVDKVAKDELKEIVEKLEAEAEMDDAVEDDDEDDFDDDSSSSSLASYSPDQLVGDWTLVCSTATANVGTNGDNDIKNDENKKDFKLFDTTKLPFVKDIRTLLNQSLEVQQRILFKPSDDSDDDDDDDDDITGESFNRIEHVLEYKPPSKLEEFLNDVPDVLKSLDLNPLQVSTGKVVLVHKAEVESTFPVLKTKLSLSSVIVNIAGKSQILEPDGADVLGINVPLGEFLNAGSFDTTYMDDTIRISRSKVGIIDQLRVFVRSTPSEEEDPSEEDDDDSNTIVMDVVDDDGIMDADIAPSDVEDP